MDIDTTHIYEWSSEKDLSPKAARYLADSVEAVLREANEVIQELLGLIQKVEADGSNGEQALGEILRYTRYAAYSNTAQTHLSEMSVQAGRVAGIVQAAQ